MTTSAIAARPICGGDMKISITVNRHGKNAVGIYCPADGRHFRGFVNHRPFAEDVLSRVLAAAGAQQLSGSAPQNRSGADPYAAPTSETPKGNEDETNPRKKLHRLLDTLGPAGP